MKRQYVKRGTADNPSYEQRKQYLDELRNTPCKDCGNIFPAVAMDFDHVHGKKDFGVMAGWRWREWHTLLAEIKKCEIVCACCHRVRTHNRR